MAARKIFRESTTTRDTNARARDSVIDELPPEETEKMGYVWVVKGTISDEEEREAAKFGSMPDISSMPDTEISGGNIAKEKVLELILPQNGEGQIRTDTGPRGTTDDFRLYIPSFVRQMHSLLSRPPELIRRDTIPVQDLLKLMPDALFDRRSYLEHISRYLELYPRIPETTSEPSEPEKEEEEEPAVREEAGGPSESEKEKEDAEITENVIETEQTEDPSKHDEEQPVRRLNEEEANAVEEQLIHAIYADPEIDTEDIQVLLKPLMLDEGEQRRRSEQGEPSSRVPERRPLGKEPFIRDYILRKVEDLENKLKRVNNDMYSSTERKGQLQYQLYEMEILKLVEKISRADTPSETDVAKLEYLTDQLKIAQGKKTAEE